MKRWLLILVLLGTAAVTVSAEPYSLVPHSTSVQAGQTVSVDWVVDTSDPQHSTNDTVELDMVGAPPPARISRIKVGSASSGTVTFTLPLAPGQYEVRIYKNGSAAGLCCISRRITATAPAVIARNPNQILVVYNLSDSDSVEVAKYYQSARSVPSGNMLGIALGSGVEDAIEWSIFKGKILPAVRKKLTTLEATNKIYYIQLIYRFPYKVENAPALVDGNAQLAPGYGLKAGHMLCSHLMDPYFDAENAYNTLAPTQYLGDNPMSGLIGEDFYRFPELDVYSNLLTLSQYRQLSGAKRIYSCTHLDSTTKTKAKAIVDHNIAAEGTNGPQGTYYFDVSRKRADLDRYYQSKSGVEDGHDYLRWDIHRAKELADEEHFTTVLTEGIWKSVYGSYPKVVSHPNAAFFYDYHEYYNDGGGTKGPDGFSTAQSYVAGSVAVIVEEANTPFRSGAAGAENGRLRDALNANADAAFVVGPEAGGAFQNYWGGLILRRLVQGGTLGDAQMSVRAFHWDHFAIGEGYYKPRTFSTWYVQPGSRPGGDGSYGNPFGWEQLTAVNIGPGGGLKFQAQR